MQRYITIMSLLLYLLLLLSFNFFLSNETVPIFFFNETYWKVLWAMHSNFCRYDNCLADLLFQYISKSLKLTAVTLLALIKSSIKAPINTRGSPRVMKNPIWWHFRQYNDKIVNKISTCNNHLVLWMMFLFVLSILQMSFEAKKKFSASVVKKEVWKKTWAIRVFSRGMKWRDKR